MIQRLLNWFRRLLRGTPSESQRERLRRVLATFADADPASFEKMLNWFDPNREFEIPPTDMKFMSVAEVALSDQLLAERREIARILSTADISIVMNIHRIVKNIESLDTLVNMIRDRKGQK